MQCAIELKEKINREDVVTGVIATDHVWPLLIELCQSAGLDYIIVDREHGPHSDEALAHVCQIGRLINFPVLIRVVSCEEDVVRRALDMGPCGLMLPCVERIEQLDAVRDAIFMPPRGRRRPGGPGNHWMSDFHYPSWRDHLENHVIVVPQIETRAGLEIADDIAAHEIVTAAGVGPYDLSADLGCCWDPDNQALQDALAKIRDAGRRAGKNMWMGMGGKSLVDKGYTFICLGEPSYILRDTLTKTAAEAAGEVIADEVEDNMPVA